MKEQINSKNSNTKRESNKTDPKSKQKLNLNLISLDRFSSKDIQPVTALANMIGSSQ